MSIASRHSKLIWTAALLFCLNSLPPIGISNACAQSAQSSAVQLEAPLEKSSETAVHAPGYSRLRTKTAAKDSSIYGKQVPDFDAAGSKTAKWALYLTGLLLAVCYVYKHLKLRKSQGAQQSAIEIVARQGVSSRASLLVVRAEERKFLVSLNGDEISLVAELDPVSGFENEFVHTGLNREEHAEPLNPALVING